MSGSTFAIINLESGKCLDASDYGSGENVIQWACTYEQHQLWRAASSPKGIKIVNVKSGKCLDASDYGRGERVIQYDCLDVANQQWFDNVTNPMPDTTKPNPPPVSQTPPPVSQTPPPNTCVSAACWYDATCSCSFGSFGQKQLCFINNANGPAWAATAACDFSCRIAYERLGLVGPATSNGVLLSGPKGPCTQTSVNSAW